MRKRRLFALPIFHDLSPEQQNLLVPLISLCHLPKNTLVFQKGDAARYLYIVESGIVEILFKPFDGSDMSISQIQRGGIFGWSAAMGREIYTASAKAMLDCEAYRFEGQALRELCENNAETGVVILEKLSQAISHRLENTHQGVMALLMQGMDLESDILEKGRH